MVVHALQCTECTETRIGRDTEDGVRPVKRACPNCGSTSAVPLATTRSN